MRRAIAAAVCLICCAAGVTSCGGREQASQSSDIADSAKQFVDLLAQGDYSRAARDFDGTMRQAMPPGKLEEAWESLTAQVGSFQRRTRVHTAREQGHNVAYVTCEFSKGKIDVKVVFDGDGKVSGLWFVNPTPA